MRRNTLLDIEQRTHIGDNFDESSDVWEVVRSEWFNLLPSNEAEYVEEDRVKSLTKYQADCAWFAGASSDMRLVGEGMTLSVVSVTNREMRNRVLDWVLVQVHG